MSSELLDSKTQGNEKNVFEDLGYICESTGLITDALQRGLDVTQMPNGDVIITEVKTVNIHYVWDMSKQRLVRVSH